MLNLNQKKYFFNRFQEYKPIEPIEKVSDLLQEEQIPIQLPPIFDQLIIDNEDWLSPDIIYNDPDGNPELPCSSKEFAYKWIRVSEFVKQQVILDAQRTGKTIQEPITSPSPDDEGPRKSMKSKKAVSKKSPKKSMVVEEIEDPYIPYVVQPIPECVKCEINDYGIPQINRVLVHPLVSSDRFPDTKAVASEIETISLFPEKCVEQDSYLWEAIYPKGIILI